MSADVSFRICTLEHIKHSDRIEDIMGKGEDAGSQYVLLFSHFFFFQNFLLRAGTGRDYVVELIQQNLYCYIENMYTERKKFSKFFTFLVFVYKSMLLKRFHIEQLCPSIDNMISLVFVHYAIM